MAQPSVQGRFVWEALLAEDVAAVTPFYTRVLGWRVQAWPADPKVTIFAAAGGPVAGMSPMTDERRAQGARSQWLPFIGADNVDAMVANAERLGGKVFSAAVDIDQVGRYAVVGDPQGAAFALFKPLQSSAPKATPQHGELAWQELATTEPEAAFDFYRALFGWQLIHRMDMGAMGFYLIFGSDGVQRGGIYKQSHPAPGPFWLPYTSVPDADKAAATATQAGGRLLNGPMDVPGGGRIAQLSDPKGVAFAVHSQAASASAPPASSGGSQTGAQAPKPQAPKPPAPAPKPAVPAPKPATPASAPAPKPAAAPPRPVPAPPKPVPPTLKPAPAAAPKPAPAAKPAPIAAKPAAPAKAAAKKATAKKAAPKKKAAKKAARPAARKVARKAAKKKGAAAKSARKSVRKSAKKKSGKKRPAARRVAKKARRAGGKARRKK